MSDVGFTARFPDELLRRLRLWRILSLVSAVSSVALLGFAEVAREFGVALASLVMVLTAIVLAILAVGFVLMYVALFLQEVFHEVSREPDSSPRKQVPLSLSGIGFGTAIIALDVHTFLQDRALIPCRASCMHDTFAHTTFPLGFWASHAFFLASGLWFLWMGLRYADRWCHDRNVASRNLLE